MMDHVCWVYHMGYNGCHLRKLHGTTGDVVSESSKGLSRSQDVSAQTDVSKSLIPGL